MKRLLSIVTLFILSVTLFGCGTAEEKNVAFLGGDGWDGVLSGVSEADYAKFTNAYFTNHIFNGDTAEHVKAFYTNYQAEYNSTDISGFAALGYDTVYIVKQAMELAGSTNKADVIEQMNEMVYKGITGTMSFDSNGDPVKEVTVITFDSKGKMVKDSSVSVGEKPTPSTVPTYEKVEGTVNIGVIANLSGDYMYYGEQVLNGIKLATKEINAGAGVLGKQINLVVKDDAQDPTTAATQYDAIKGSVDYIIGAVLSSTTEAVAAKAAADNMPLITASGTAAPITVNRPSVFRACFTDPYQGEVLAQFSKEKGFTKVAVLKNTGSDYSVGVAEAFVKKAKELGIEVVITESYTDATLTTSITTIMDKLATKDIDAILAPDYTTQNAKIVLAAYDAGLVQLEE